MSNQSYSLKKQRRSSRYDLLETSWQEISTSPIILRKSKLIGTTWATVKGLNILS